MVERSNTFQKQIDKGFSEVKHWMNHKGAGLVSMYQSGVQDIMTSPTTLSLDIPS